MEGRAVDIRAFKPKRIPPLMWRECIKKVWEVDPLLRTNCGGEMKLISFVYERAVIKKILFHLKLYLKPTKQRIPPVPSRRFSESVRYLSYDNGWPGYEESVVDAESL